MSDKPKTHYRKVFKSDHLGAADLEDMIEAKSNLIFTISHVKQEWGVAVAGRKGNHNIAYFKENIKPWVLNATNSKVVKKFAGGSSFVEDWQNIPVQLYIDHKVKMKGEVVGGVRIKPTQPRLTKPLLDRNSPDWANAIEAFKRDGNCNVIEQHRVVTAEDKKAIQEAANAVS